MAAPLDPERLLHSILESIGEPFYAVDGAWRITLYNEDAARHFGRPASEMIGRKLWDVFAHDVHAERGRILFDAMARRTIVKGETLSMIGDRWVSYCMFPLDDGLGVIFRDITDHKNAQEHRDRAEEALRKRTTELEAVLETVPTAVLAFGAGLWQGGQKIARLDARGLKPSAGLALNTYWRTA